MLTLHGGPKKGYSTLEDRIRDSLGFDDKMKRSMLNSIDELKLQYLKLANVDWKTDPKIIADMI